MEKTGKSERVKRVVKKKGEGGGGKPTTGQKNWKN